MPSIQPQSAVALTRLLANIARCMTTDRSMLSNGSTALLAIAGFVAPLDVPPLGGALCAVDFGLGAHV